MSSYKDAQAFVPKSSSLCNEVQSVSQPVNQPASQSVSHTAFSREQNSGLTTEKPTGAKVEADYWNPSDA